MGQAIHKRKLTIQVHHSLLAVVNREGLHVQHQDGEKPYVQLLQPFVKHRHLRPPERELYVLLRLLLAIDHEEQVPTYVHALFHDVQGLNHLR